MAGQRIESRLHQVHDQIIDKIQINAKAAVDRQRAAKMESILYRIKNLKTQPENSIEGFLDEQAETLIEQSLSALNANRMGKKKLSGQDLFHRAHGTSTSYGGDDIFEEELAAVLSTIEQEATGSTIGLGGYLVGGQQANISLTGEISKDVQKVMTKYVNGMAKKINEKPHNEQKQWSKPQARSGKVDVNGLSIVDITANLNPLWADLYQTFSGCTFSVKNYSSYFTNQLNIHLGNTDYYKALYGVLSSLDGYDQKTIDKIIYSGLNSYLKSQNNTVALHFYHLRFIYELTGVGLYDQQGDPISGVDFLIYNDPGSDAIFVRSTADLIAQELENNRVGSPLGGIAISKASFKNEET